MKLTSSIIILKSKLDFWKLVYFPSTYLSKIHEKIDQFSTRYYDIILSLSETSGRLYHNIALFVIPLDEI